MHRWNGAGNGWFRIKIAGVIPPTATKVAII
jgi:hypothetical protein